MEGELFILRTVVMRARLNWLYSLWLCKWYFINIYPTKKLLCHVGARVVNNSGKKTWMSVLDVTLVASLLPRSSSPRPSDSFLTFCTLKYIYIYIKVIIQLLVQPSEPWRNFLILILMCINVNAPYFDGFDASNQRGGRSSWWSPIQLLTTIVRVLLCLVLVIAAHLGNKVILISVITADVTGHR